jgi:hypothetical protein
MATSLGTESAVPATLGRQGYFRRSIAFCIQNESIRNFDFMATHCLEKGGKMSQTKYGETPVAVITGAHRQTPPLRFLPNEVTRLPLVTCGSQPTRSPRSGPLGHKPKPFCSPPNMLRPGSQRRAIELVAEQIIIWVPLNCPASAGQNSEFVPRHTDRGIRGPIHSPFVDKPHFSPQTKNAPTPLCPNGGIGRRASFRS